VLLGLLESPRPMPHYSNTASYLKSSVFSSAYSEPMRLLLETNLVVRESCGAQQLTSVPKP